MWVSIFVCGGRDAVMEERYIYPNYCDPSSYGKHCQPAGSGLADQLAAMASRGQRAAAASATSAADMEASLQQRVCQEPFVCQLPVEPSLRDALSFIRFPFCASLCPPR
jgi:hypothetical protein